MNLKDKLYNNNGSGVGANSDLLRHVRPASPSTNFLNTYFLKNGRDDSDKNDATLLGALGSGGSGSDINMETALKSAEVLLTDLQRNLNSATSAIIKNNINYTVDMSKMYRTAKEEENLRKTHQQLMHDNKLAFTCIKNVKDNLLKVKPITDGFYQWKNNFLGGVQEKGKSWVTVVSTVE